MEQIVYKQFFRIMKYKQNDLKLKQCYQQTFSRLQTDKKKKTFLTNDKA